MIDFSYLKKKAFWIQKAIWVAGTVLLFGWFISYTKTGEDHVSMFGYLLAAISIALGFHQSQKADEHVEEAKEAHGEALAEIHIVANETVGSRALFVMLHKEFDKKFDTFMENMSTRFNTTFVKTPSIGVAGVKANPHSDSIVTGKVNIEVDSSMNATGTVNPFDNPAFVADVKVIFSELIDSINYNDFIFGRILALLNKLPDDMPVKEVRNALQKLQEPKKSYES